MARWNKTIKKCQECGESYLGGANSKYCYSCGDQIRQKQRNENIKRWREKNKK